jgi:hypothetical protein
VLRAACEGMNTPHRGGLKWYRAYVGTTTDKKLGAIALRAGVSRSVVVASWHVILESAADANAGGECQCDEFDVSAALGEPLEAIQRVMVCFAEANMFRDGRVTAWQRRQYESDSSAERTKQWRDRNKQAPRRPCDVTVTPPDTESDTDTEHIQKKDIRAVATAPRPDVYFEEFWGKYPKRDGANPKEPARKKFLAAVKSGADPEAIIRAAKRSADVARSNGQIGTPYVPQAVTWLNQQRWGDYPALTVIAGTPTPPDPSLPSDAELRARYERKEATGREQDQTSGPARVFPQGAGADGEEPAGFRDQARVG